MNCGKPDARSDQKLRTVIPELASDLSADPRMAPVIEIFLSEFPVLMECVTAAANQKDLPGILKSVHKLKGAAASAGYARLFELASQVEDHAEQGHLETVLPLIDDLNRICRLSMPTAAPAAKP